MRLQTALSQLYARSMAKAVPDTLSIGLELEFPIVTRSGTQRESNLPIIARLTEALGMVPIRFAMTGEVIAARQPASGVVISYEYARSLIEISTAPARCCVELHRSVWRIVASIRAVLQPLGLDLAFTGKHPQEWARSAPALPTPHYAAVDDFLKRFTKELEQDRNFVAYAASVQTHVGATLGTLPGLLEMLRDLGFVRALLLANAPSDERPPRLLIARDHYWRESAFGRLMATAPPSRLQTVADVFSVEESKAIWCAVRGGVHWVFEPVVLSALADGCTVEAHGRIDASSIAKRIRLELSDLETFRGYDDVVPTRYGTVEVRGDCQQPADSLLAATALYVGLATRLKDAVALVRAIVPEGEGPRLRGEAIRAGWAMAPSRPGLPVEAACADVLDLARSGLRMRGHGEEFLLDPLQDRLGRRSNPAIENRTTFSIEG